MNVQASYYEKIYQAMLDITSHPTENWEEVVAKVFSTALFSRAKLYSLMLFSQYQGRVACGPFRGMVIPREVIECGYFRPGHLVGCYEEELHPTIWKIINTQYDIVIDIGCASGYYAVGLAKTMPHAKIYAFDTDLVARHHCHQAAKINQADDRIFIDTLCDHNTLNRLGIFPGRKLILCNIEGAEYDLLDPDRVPILKNLDILVGTHRGEIDLHHDILIKRFAATHHIQHIPIGSRDWTKYPNLQWMPLLDRSLTLSDGRPFSSPWLFMTQHTPI